MIKEDDLLYDDDDAVKFIRKTLPEDVRNKYDDDNIIYIVDLIYDYYDSKGVLDEGIQEENDEDEIDIDEDELVAYVTTHAIAEGIGKFEAEEIALIVQAELEYCESLGLFD